MTLADGDAESGASGLSAGNGGSAEEGGVSDGVAEDKGKCKKARSHKQDIESWQVFRR